MTKTKAFNIDKSLVVSAYRRVKTSAGAAGIDKQSLADFDKRLVDNLYKIWNRLSSASYFPPAVKAVAIQKKLVGERIVGVHASNVLRLSERSYRADGGKTGL